MYYTPLRTFTCLSVLYLNMAALQKCQIQIELSPNQTHLNWQSVFFFLFFFFSQFCSYLFLRVCVCMRAYAKLQMCSYVLTVFWIYINKVRKGKGGKLMCWGWLLLSHMSVCLSLLCWTWTAHVNSDFGEWNNTKKNQHVIFLKLNSTENMHISW